MFIRLYFFGGVTCRYAYFHHLPQVDLPYINIPLHTVIKLTPKAYGCDEERFVFFIRSALVDKLERIQICVTDQSGEYASTETEKHCACVWPIY